MDIVNQKFSLSSINSLLIFSTPVNQIVKKKSQKDENYIPDGSVEETKKF